MLQKRLFDLLARELCGVELAEPLVCGRAVFEVVAERLNYATVLHDVGARYKMAERFQELSWLDVIAWFPAKALYREWGRHDMKVRLVWCNQAGLGWLLCGIWLRS